MSQSVQKSIGCKAAAAPTCLFIFIFFTRLFIFTGSDASIVTILICKQSWMFTNVSYGADEYRFKLVFLTSFRSVCVRFKNYILLFKAFLK